MLANGSEGSEYLTNLPTESNVDENNGAPSGKVARRYSFHDEEEGELEGNENDNFIR